MLERLATDPAFAVGVTILAVGLLLLVAVLYAAGLLRLPRWLADGAPLHDPAGWQPPPAPGISASQPVYRDDAHRLAEIRRRLAEAEAVRWEYAILPGAGNDVGRLGPYVYRPHWGSVAAADAGVVAHCPQDSPQYSAVLSRMDFIFNSGRDIDWLLARCASLDAQLQVAMTHNKDFGAWWQLENARRRATGEQELLYDAASEKWWREGLTDEDRARIDPRAATGA